jgi:hypothetical protein
VRFTGSSKDKLACGELERALGSSHGGLQGAGSGLCGTRVDCRHCKPSVYTLFQLLCQVLCSVRVFG